MKTIGYLGAWGMYWLGDFFSKVLELAPDEERWQWWFDVWYCPYNWCMRKSLDIQDATECNGPWAGQSEASEG